jgi:hypothetical protein
MKWFKHFSDSLDDPFIQELLEKFGAQGYLAYFGLIEIIAKENGSKLTGKLEISPSFLKQKLHISSRKLQEIFNFSSTFPKLFFNFSGEKWKFDVPKLLELKDNYSKDLQVTGKKPSNHKEVEVEVEVEEEVEAHKPKEKTFCPNSDELRLSELLLDLILIRNQTFKKPNLQSWSKQVDLMIRVDKRRPKEIEQIINWCQSDIFWQNNILSMEKLRKQYDQLKMKMDKNTEKSNSDILARWEKNLKLKEKKNDK